MILKDKYNAVKIEELIAELEKNGVAFSLDAGSIRMRTTNASALNPDAIAAIRERKAEAVACLEIQFSKSPEPVVGKLENRKTAGLAPCGSEHCAGCYEVAPGVRLHPPKSGPGWVT